MKKLLIALVRVQNWVIGSRNTIFFGLTIFALLFLTSAWIVTATYWVIPAIDLHFENVTNELLIRMQNYNSESSISFWISSLIVFAPILLLLELIRQKYVEKNALSVRSLSLFDLIILAQSSEDRADSIKEFYDWNYATLGVLAKAVLAFLLGQVAVLIELTYSFLQSSDSPLSADKEWELQLALGFSIFGLALIEVFLMIKLRKIPREYVSAIRIYSLLRR